MGGLGHRHDRRRGLGRVLASATVIALGASVAPGAIRPARALHPFTSETFSVAADSIEGVSTTQSLHAGAVYRAVASGVFEYGHNANQLADVECTLDRTPFDPTSNLTALPTWERHRYAFIGTADATKSYNLYNSDFRDPDPTDDPIDLYVDNRNVEWQPIDARNLSRRPNALGCHDGDPGKGNRHTYEVYFTPTRSGPVNFRIFDLYYADNGELQNVPGGSEVRVTVSAVGGTALPVERHVETVLVAAEGSGATSRPLEAGKPFLVVAHGMWSYRGEFFLADAECSRNSSWDPTYRRNRWGAGANDTGELWMNGGQVDWEPVIPAQVKSRFHLGEPSKYIEAARSDCDAAIHFYSKRVTGTGAPLTFSISVPPPPDDVGPRTGTLSVDVYEVM